MNDPFQDKLREAAWRRSLTAAEQAELRAWLAKHPDAAADWESEAGLARAMQHLGNAPISSNFTARVLAETARLNPADRGTVNLRRRIWLALVPRLAVATLVLTAGFFAFHHHQLARRDRIARDLATLSGVAVVSDPKILQDFETIRRLSQTPAADEELIALLK